MTRLRDGTVAGYTTFNYGMAAGRQSYAGRRPARQSFRKTHKWPKALSRS